ncbi:hypothetical protein MN608_03906 [Microdochium nivale]|nr:hypothetical protein MN608_03906 [Microdochium nivale]
MCMEASCSVCSKTSWMGCGAHVPGVLDLVPVKDLCTCKPQIDVGGRAYPPKAGSGKSAEEAAAEAALDS